MSNVVSWVVEFAVKSGELDNFKALVKEMVAATQANEPDAMTYEYFISADGTSGHIYE